MSKRDQDRRQVAWLDFCNLEAQGIKPNPNALYNYYIDLNREHPEMRARIPTTNRSVVYQWAREDKWVERWNELQKADAEQKSEAYQNIRNRGYGQLVSLQGQAVEALMELASSKNTNAKVRLEAAESILDRTGLGRQPARPPKDEVGPNPDAGTRVAPPPADATEEQLHIWMDTLEGSNMNA